MGSKWNLTASMTLRAEVEDFLHQDAALLDAWNVEEWLRLWSEDGHYVVPTNDNPDADPERAEELRQALGAIDDLAPGDFATVKRQAQMLGEELPPQSWIEQLAAEAKAKMLGLRRQQLGFAS